MVRYKWIDIYLFMDTLFATNEKKNSRGDTCLQLFVTDTVFLYVVPIRSKGQVLQVVKLFAKDIGAPDDIIYNTEVEQKSHILFNLCK